MKQNTIKKNLLIVDDNEDSRIIAIEILNQLDLIILEAGCAKDALKLFHIFHKEIFLVIIDLRLPDFDGYELLEQVRHINPTVKAIAMSAIDPSEFVARSKIAGFNACLSKPLNFDKFLKIVKEYS